MQLYAIKLKHDKGMLTMTTMASSKEDAIDKLFKKVSVEEHVPDAEIEGTAVGNVSFTVPYKRKSKSDHPDFSKQDILLALKKRFYQLENMDERELAEAIELNDFVDEDDNA